MNERQKITIGTNLGASKYVYLKATGSEDIIVVNVAGDETDWANAIMTLDLYASNTVTVSFKSLANSPLTGALSSTTLSATGETVYTGQVLVNFGGYNSNVNVPQIYAVAGEHQQLVIADSSATGAWFGVSEPSNTTQSTWQTAIRALGGNKADVVIKGAVATSNAGGNETQTIVFTSVPALQQLAIRKNGVGTLSAVFAATDSNATIKARIEEIYGTTATVTGSLSTSTDGVTGETLYSGTLTVVFSGTLAATDVVQMEVVSGEVQRLTLAGEAWSGTFNGATIPVGTSAASAQTLLRATGGSWANVLVAGGSS